MDARWDAVMVANLRNDQGGRRPTREEFAHIYSLAYEIWISTSFTYEDLGKMMCPFTDVKRAASRVWQWVQKGTLSNPATRPHSFPVRLS